MIIMTLLRKSMFAIVLDDKWMDAGFLAGLFTFKYQITRTLIVFKANFHIFCCSLEGFFNLVHSILRIFNILFMFCDLFPSLLTLLAAGIVILFAWKITSNAFSFFVVERCFVIFSSFTLCLLQVGLQNGLFFLLFLNYCVYFKTCLSNGKFSFIVRNCMQVCGLQFFRKF